MSERGNWSSKFGFVLAAAGSAVGLGNIWKFPYMTYENQGGAFVLIYLLCVLAIGIPIMTAEMMLGRRTQKNAVGAFKELGGNRWKFVGGLGVFTGFILLSYYSVVAGWTLEYVRKSVFGAFTGLTQEQVGAQFVAFVNDPFWQIFWHAAFMCLTVGVVIGGVAKGIERVTKTLMPLLLVIIMILAGQAFMTGGGVETLRFLFLPDFSKTTLDTVLEAVGQAFFSLSLGMGAIITYGSYMNKDDNLPKSALIVSGLDTLVAVLACLVIFPIIFSFDLTPTKSAGIMFTTLPVIFLKMPGGFLFAPLFFLLVAFAALTSTISLLEVVVAYFIDELNWRRKQATLVIGSAVFVLGIFSALSNGAVGILSTINVLGKASTVGVFNTLDYLAANWLLPVGGLLIAIFVGWRLAKTIKQEEFNTGESTILRYGIWDVLLRFVAPIAVTLIIAAVILGREFN
jgi:NSS family neurotransmitter:Na+ symporter